MRVKKFHLAECALFVELVFAFNSFISISMKVSSSCRSLHSFLFLFCFRFLFLCVPTCNCTVQYLNCCYPHFPRPYLSHFCLSFFLRHGFAGCRSGYSKTHIYPSFHRAAETNDRYVPEVSGNLLFTALYGDAAAAAVWWSSAKSATAGDRADSAGHRPALCEPKNSHRVHCDEKIEDKHAK
jgi:hypothetical protein